MSARGISLALALALGGAAAVAAEEPVVPCPAVPGYEVTGSERVDGDEATRDCEYVEAGELPWPAARLRLERRTKGHPGLYSALCTDHQRMAGEDLVHAPGKAAMVHVRVFGVQDRKRWRVAAARMLRGVEAVECPEDYRLEITVEPTTTATATTPPAPADRVLDPPRPRPGEALLASRRDLKRAKVLFQVAENLYYGRGGKKKDRAEALRRYKLAARHGHAASLYSVAYMLRFGQGTAKDEAAAVRYGIMGAEAGSGSAAGLVGDLYYFGRGVPKSYKTAVHWYRKGVAKGHASSNYSMGFMLEHGQGVAKDQRAAAEHYKRAADKGNRNGMYEYAECLRGGQGTGKNTRLARALFEKAIQKGHVASKVSLAQMLEGGEGGPRDTRRARKLYQEAAKAGDETAQAWVKKHG